MRIRIWDLGSAIFLTLDLVYGIGDVKIRIRDKHPGSGTLLLKYGIFLSMRRHPLKQHEKRFILSET